MDFWFGFFLSLFVYFILCLLLDGHEIDCGFGIELKLDPKWVKKWSKRAGIVYSWLFEDDDDDDEDDGDTD
jgi:hypothetical protein